jgi:hypothetical protein
VRHKSHEGNVDTLKCAELIKLLQFCMSTKHFASLSYAKHKLIISTPFLNAQSEQVRSDIGAESLPSARWRFVGQASKSDMC